MLSLQALRPSRSRKSATRCATLLHTRDAAPHVAAVAKLTRQFRRCGLQAWLAYVSGLMEVAGAAMVHFDYMVCG